MTNVLKEFLANGSFRGVSVGQAERAVDASFGEPDYIDEPTPGFRLKYYGNLEMTIHDDRLIQIKLVFLNRRSRIPSREQDGIDESIEFKDLDTLLECLDSTGISWQIDRKLTFDRQLCIATEGRTRVFYDLDARCLQAVSSRLEED